MTTFNVTDADSLATIQGVVDGLVAGDIMNFADGTYNNTTNTALDFGTSGASGNPITIRGNGTIFGAEFVGAGFTAPDTGAQIGFLVTGDWINLSNMFIKDYFTSKFWSAMRVYGDNCNVSEIWTEFNYGGGIFIGADNPCNGTIVRNCVSKNNGAFTGFAFRHSSDGVVGDVVDDCHFIDCVSYFNGFSDDGVTLFADSPGNADSIGITKEFSDGTTASSFVGIVIKNSAFQRCIGWRSADDILDFSVNLVAQAGGGNKIVGNILLDPGTEGTRLVKMLRFSGNPFMLAGNIIFDNQNTGTTGLGFELRYGDGSDGFQFMNNTAVDMTGDGYQIFYSGLTDTAASKIQNNMVYLTDGTIDQSTNATVSNNHLAGDPDIVDDTKLDRTDLDLTYVAGDTVKEFHRQVLDQVWKWGMPNTGNTVLIDGGVLDANVHMATADNDTTTPADPEDLSLVHWTGSVPDIGAVQYRLINPPTNLNIT